MSTPDKPDPVHAWTYVEKLLIDEEVERLEKMSGKELEDAMAAEGLDEARVPSTEQLLAGAARAAERRQARERARVVVLKPARTRTRWAALLAAATLGVLFASVVASNGAAILAFLKGGAEIGPDDAGPLRPRETPQERAEKLRDEAEDACRGKLWSVCDDKLDQADKLYPAGWMDPREQRLRQAVYDGQNPGRPDADPGRKPRVP
jgi:hypothetical protein